MPRGVSRLDEARLQGRLWTPELLRGDGAAWFDFSDRATLTIPSGVSQINDRFGFGSYMEQGTAGDRPNWLVSGINGQPAVDFVASSRRMVVFASAKVQMANAFLLGVVYRMGSASATNTRVVMFSNSIDADWNNTRGAALIRRSAANQIDTFQNSAARVTITVPDDVPHVHVIASDGTNLAHFLNGAQAGTGTWSSPNFGGTDTRFGVNCESGAALPTEMRGQIGEIIAIRGDRSARDRQALEGYLSWKWGIPLAASHPHRNAPPLIGG